MQIAKCKLQSEDCRSKVKRSKDVFDAMRNACLPQAGAMLYAFL
jgi:hypothetical protein